ncbi:MAG: homocysteine S-methyltransferase family protein [Acidimicrobiales bacterium]
MDLAPRLAAGETILIDGATGTELELLAVPTVENAWCALASLTSPEAVLDVHRRNLDAGAELIIANTFVCSRHVLESAGHGEEFEMLNRRGVELARQARDESGRDAVVAGSISTTTQGLAKPPFDVVVANFIDQVRIQVDAGVELFALEMMRDVELTQAILDAIRPTGIPVWVGYSCELDGGEPRLINDGPLLADALVSIQGQPIELVAIMHTEVVDTDSCLDVAFEHWSGPIGVYAHTGGWEPPNWVFENMISAEDYAAASMRWVARGVQVIGGCCGIRPGHIAVIGERLAAQRVAAAQADQGQMSPTV